MVTALNTTYQINGRSTTTVMTVILAGLLSFALPSARSQQGPPAGPPPGGQGGPGATGRGGPPPGRGMGSPNLPTTPPQRVSEHVYELTGFPNIIFAVGDRATLVVDTGMGPKNGTLAAKDAAALKPGNILYLTTTHFHPEHASGEGGFPAGTILVRNAAQ